MSVNDIVFKVQGLALVLLCSGCATSVRDINVDDSAIIGSAQLNYHHSSGRAVTQLEYQGMKFSDHIFVAAAKDKTLFGEQRLRDTSVEDAPENQFIGVGEVKADYKLQQVSARSLFQLNNRKLVQFYLGPELTLLQLDSKYSSGQRGIVTDTEKFGAGISFVTRWQVLEKLSLNGSAGATLYENESWGIMHQIFFRYQPDKRFHIDAGVYGSFYFIANDRISYEERMFLLASCIKECVYGYDGTQNSDIEIDLTGFRFGIGFDF